MADVFISYSRRDAAFVKRLTDGLTAQGREAFIDVSGIRDGEVFPAVLQAQIEAAPVFVFVISPDSARSEYCRRELDLAVAAGQRIVPVEHVPVASSALPEKLRERMWVPFGGDGEGDFERSLARLGEALDHDAALDRAHTYWLVKALDWSHAGEDHAFLLRGRELADAEAWLANAEGRDPGPTDVQRRLVARSGAFASRRLRALTAASLGVAVIAIVLVVVAVISRDQALNARQAARSTSLAEIAESEIQRDPELAVLLARQAVERSPTAVAELALRTALDDSPVLGHLNPTGAQACGAPEGLASHPNLAFSPDGRGLAQASCDGTVRIVNPTDGAPLARRRAAATAPCVAFVSGRGRLAVCTPGGVLLLDPRTLRRVATLPGGGALRFLAASPDGRWLTGGGADGLWLWDLRSGRGRRVLSVPHTSVSGAVFLDRDRRLLIGLAYRASDPLLGLSQDPRDGLAVVDARTGRLLAVGLPGRSATAIDLRPGGREVAVSAFSAAAGLHGGVVAAAVRVALPSLHPIATVLGETQIGLGRVAWSPDGRQLAVATASGVDILTPDGRQVSEFAGLTGTSSIAFSPDGARVVGYDVTGQATMWRARAGGDRLVQLPGAVGDLVANGPELWASTTTGAIVGLESGTGRALHRLQFAVPSGTLESAEGLASAPQLSAGGRSVFLTRAESGSVFALPGGERRFAARYPRSPAPTDAAVPNPDQTEAMLSTGARSPFSPVLVDLRTGRASPLTGTPPSCGAGWSAIGAWSPDARIYYGWTDCGTVGAYDLSRRRLVHVFTVPSLPLAGAASPSGRLFALAALDGTVTIYDSTQGRVLRTLLGSISGPLVGTNVRVSLAFSPGGRWLFYGVGGQVTVFDTQSWASERQIRVPGVITALTSTAGALYVGTAAGSVLRYLPCPACGDARALLAEAGLRRLRPLTPAERASYLH